MTHWKKLTNPNYLGAYSIEDGQDLILTIKDVKQEVVTGADGKKEECLVCYFNEDKPMILNATNAKQITKNFGTPYIEQWRGRKIQIGQEKVKAFGEVVEALRVRKFNPNTVEIRCEDCKKNISPAIGMNVEQLAAYTESKYGSKLCADCAKKRANVVKKAEGGEENVNDAEIQADKE